MPWFKVDDTLALHPKTVAAGNAALGLWTRAGAWSMQTLTDGFVPTAVARQLGSRREAQRLVDVGLWDLKDDGYVFHEWEQRQPSRLQLNAERESARIRQQRGREAARRRREEDPPSDPFVTGEVTP
jgi:hypothetical protein